MISVTHQTLYSGHFSYLRSLLHLQHSRSTRSSSLITLGRPFNQSHLKNTAPSIWNSSPADVRQISYNYSSTASPLVFHTELQAYLFHRSFPPWDSSDHIDGYLRYWRTWQSCYWLISLQLYFIWSYQCLRIRRHQSVQLLQALKINPISYCYSSKAYSEGSLGWPPRAPLWGAKKGKKNREKREKKEENERKTR